MINNNIENRYLVKFAGEKGANKKCGLFKSIDGPNAEEINDILEKADLNGASDEMFEMLEQACKLVEEDLPGAEEQINNIACSELGIENHRTIYNLVREAFQLSDEKCKSVLITKIVTSKKRVFVKEIEAVEKFEVLAFDINGNMIEDCTIDEPLEVTREQLLDLIGFYGNKKTVVNKESKSKTITLPEHITGRKSDEKDDSVTSNNILQNRNKVKDGFITISKKTVVAVAVVFAAVFCAGGVKMIDLVKIENKHNHVMSMLNDEARAKLEHAADMEMAAKKLGLEFDATKKVFVDAANSN